MNRTTLALSERWRNVRERRRDCLSDWFQDAAYLLTGYFV